MEYDIVLHTYPFIDGTNGQKTYDTYHVNIDLLNPGVHSFNVRNTQPMKLYLDKFRLFSNVNQNFYEKDAYNSCDPKKDLHCTCDAVPDPTCQRGVSFKNYCCMASCGTCGGTGCSSRDGGAFGCCTINIFQNGYSCAANSAPCLITP